jgi:NAD(P)-dependent dehydrogenase (short-subunit alcohol dehydrogenase family)
MSEEVAIVTGAASGIGLEVARGLARRGIAVVLADKNNDGVQAAATAIALENPRVVAQFVDVGNTDSVNELITKTLEEFGRIDILVHSAGIGIERAFLDTSTTEWQRIIDIDLTGTFVTSQAVARAMVPRRYGRVVHLASTAGIRGGVGRAAYGAAKGGVIALTKVMAVELAPYGITVNALAPGAIDTDLVTRMHSRETRRVYRRAIPLDRYGTPVETAAAAIFLASPEASYITGHILAVDGGFLAAGLMYRD